MARRSTVHMSLGSSAHAFDIEAGGRPLLSDGVPAVAWRYVGEESFRWSVAKDLRTAGALYVANLGPFRVEVLIRRGEDGEMRMRGDLHCTAPRSVEVARFHYAHGTLRGAWNLLAPIEDRLFPRNVTVEATRRQREAQWRQAHVVWPRLADPIHDAPDWGVATDVAVFLTSLHEPGLVVGFTGPGSAFGEIGIRTTGNVAGSAATGDGGPNEPSGDCYLGVLLDNTVMDPGQTRTMEEATLWFGDWQEGMQHWAQDCAHALGVRDVRRPLVGWCSWYQHGHRVLPEHVVRAADELAQWPTPPGGRVVQIDDGYQVMPGDWRPNERFDRIWDDLPRIISDSGSIPGLWLAPTTIFHRHPVVAEHPDWLQRLPDGEPAVSFSNWGWCDRHDYRWGDESSPTYYLDPDHPGAREFMFDIVSRAVKAGWRYLKLDFTYALSTARNAVDRSRTSLESLRSLYELFREAAGEEAILCACIGTMGRYALGHVDTARLGGDIGAKWEKLEGNLREFIPRLSVNGLWWNGDPDVFYMRAERSDLSLEESWVLTGTIGLIGGVFLTSDFPSQWSPEAARRVEYFWNEHGPSTPSGHQAGFAEDGRLRALSVATVESSGKTVHRIGMYNWADVPATVEVRLSRLGLPAGLRIRSSFPDQPTARLEDGALVCRGQPPHSLRIVECE